MSRPAVAVRTVGGYPMLVRRPSLYRASDAR